MSESLKFGASSATADQGGRNLRFLPPLETPFIPCRSELTSRMHDFLVISRTAPVAISGNTTTVLAGKGTLRRAKSGRALAHCAPLWRCGISDGRLRRDHEKATVPGRPSADQAENRWGFSKIGKLA